MGCCGSKDKKVNGSENQSAANPEAASLRHPGAQPGANLRDEERGKADGVNNEVHNQKVKKPVVSNSKGEVAPASSSKPFSLKQIMGVFNEVRTNPNKFADRVQQLYLDHINERGKNKRTNIMTNEGKGPYVEAKKFLASQKPLNKCELDVGLTAAAYLHSVYCVAINQ